MYSIFRLLEPSLNLCVKYIYVPFFYTIKTKTKMLMISHRGYGAEGNTKAALQNAQTFGFDVLELDLHKTADKEIV